MKISASALKTVFFPLLFVMAITIAYALVFTLSEFADSPYSSLNDFLELAFQWTAIAVGTFGLLYLLSINKYVFAMTFPLLVTFSSILTGSVFLNVIFALISMLICVLICKILEKLNLKRFIIPD